MRFKHILFILLLFTIFNGFSADTDTLLNQTYCIDGNHYTEFYYNRDDVSTIYQWQSNDGTGFVDLQNNSNFSGVTTNTLGISFIDLAYDGLLIRCLVTISTVSDTSNSATLFVRDGFFKEEVDSMCLGGIYYWHNDTFLLAGTYYDSLQTINGCDSIYKLDLSHINNYKYDTALVCEGDSIFLQNEWQTTEGTYRDTLVYTNTCDTILQTQLYVEYKNQFEYKYICDGDSMFLGGAWQTNPGLYFDNYVSANGCDITLTGKITQQLVHIIIPNQE